MNTDHIFLRYEKKALCLLSAKGREKLFLHLKQYFSESIFLGILTFKATKVEWEDGVAFLHTNTSVNEPSFQKKGSYL